MALMNPQQAEREAQRAQANREELVERMARACFGGSLGGCGGRFLSVNFREIAWFS